MKRVGITGIGTYLPDQVRTNAFWPEEVVARWREKTYDHVPRARDAVKGRETEGHRLSFAALEKLRDDPFQGVRERRVTDDSMASSDLEVLASRQALEAASLS